MRTPKLPESERLDIGRARFAGVPVKELAKEHSIGVATVQRYADEFARKGGGSPYTEFGISGLARFGGTIQEDYHKSWRSLRELSKTVKEMGDHPIVSAALFTIEIAIRKAEWSTVPGGETAIDIAAAQFLAECVSDMSHTLDDHISQVISMFSYGFAPFEVVYKRRLGMERDPFSKFDDGRVGWRKFGLRAQDTLSPGREWDFDEAGGVQGMYQTPPNGGPERFLSIERLLLYRTTATKNNPQGRSALRAAFMPWYYSKNLTEVEAISAERLGSGLPVIYLGKGTSKSGATSDYAYAKQAVRDTRADEQAGLVFPFHKQYAGGDGSGILFELVSPPGKGGIDFNQVITRHNQEIAQSLLTQFMFLGMGETGTQSLATEIRDQFILAINAWLSNISDVINRYAIPRLFALNIFPGLISLPRLEPGDVSDVDVSQLIETMARAVQTGIVLADETTEAHARGLLGLPEREAQPEGEGGREKRDAKPEKDEKDEPPEMTRQQVKAELFAALRGRGPGARRVWEREINTYQKELRAEFAAWTAELEEDVDDEEAAILLAAALFRLDERLRRLGRERILDSVALGIGEDEFRQEYINVAAKHMGANELFLSGLRTDIGAKARELIAAGIVGAALAEALDQSFSSRVELYAGEAWGALQETVGVRSGLSENPKIHWVLDPRAQHCATCLGYGDQEYSSYAELLAQTGGAAPGINTDCDGNCRCSLEVFGNDEDSERPTS